MIGFFEHQYLKFKKNHLLNLIGLAKADGNLHEEEEKLIYRLGEKYGLKNRQISSLITNDKESVLHIPHNHRDKMNQLYDLLLMMYADGIVDNTELRFCEQFAEKYGLKKEIIKWLADFFEAEKRPSETEWESIIEDSLQFEQ